MEAARAGSSRWRWLIMNWVSFLRACARCRRELSPNRDVYMYRGDQGFCSEECRLQQILTDEAREHNAMIKRLSACGEASCLTISNSNTAGHARPSRRSVARRGD